MSLENKIKELLNEADSEVFQSFFQSEFNEEDNGWDDDSVVEFRQELRKNKIKFEHVDCFGGEGMGEDYWSVYKFESEDTSDDFVYVKFQGWYQSYNGSEYTEWYFVRPRQVMNTEFVQV